MKGLPYIRRKGGYFAGEVQKGALLKQLSLPDPLVKNRANTLGSVWLKNQICVSHSTLDFLLDFLGKIKSIGNSDNNQSAIWKMLPIKDTIQNALRASKQEIDLINYQNFCSFKILVQFFGVLLGLAGPIFKQIIYVLITGLG